jgi:hypothetical protein
VFLSPIGSVPKSRGGCRTIHWARAPSRAQSKLRRFPRHGKFRIDQGYPFLHRAARNDDLAILQRIYRGNTEEASNTCYRFGPAGIFSFVKFTWYGPTYPKS